MAVDYEPVGSLASIDVFFATPLRVVALSRKEWVTEHLSKWQHFSRSKPRFHEVNGSHYTMIDQENVESFYHVL